MSSRQHPHDHPAGTRAPYAQHSTWQPSHTQSSGGGGGSRYGHLFGAAQGMVTSLPCDAEAERGVLSCFFHDPVLLGEHQTLLPEACFYHPANRLLYEAMKDLYNDSCPVEYVAITSHLRDTGKLEAIGGPAVLSEIVHFVPTPEHYGYYKRILKRKLEERSIITACTETVARMYEHAEDFEQRSAEVFARFAQMERERESADEPRGSEESVVDLMDYVPDPGEDLLGEGWLRRGGAALLVGPSGIGKSSASMQQDICWALGREAFGIMPARALRILTIQSENDRGDLGEMSRSIREHLGLTEEERRLLRENTRYKTWTAARGPVFLAELRKAISKFKPDLVRVDPLLGFAGCKIEDSEQVGNFLRAGLNPILEEHRCGMILAHHTPKPRQDTRKERSAFDFAYAGAGGAEITNWARASLVIEPKGEGVFAYHAAKRGRRIGWKGPLDFAETTRYYRHSIEPGTMYWEQITDPAEQQAAEERSGNSKKDPCAALLELVPADEPISRDELITAANKKCGIGVNALSTALRKMLNATPPKLYAWKVRRPRTNPVTKIWTSPQVEEGEELGVG